MRVYIHTVYIDTHRYCIHICMYVYIYTYIYIHMDGTAPRQKAYARSRCQAEGLSEAAAALLWRWLGPGHDKCGVLKPTSRSRVVATRP